MVTLAAAVLPAMVVPGEATVPPLGASDAIGNRHTMDTAARASIDAAARAEVEGQTIFLHVGRCFRARWHNWQRLATSTDRWPPPEQKGNTCDT
jgi:hypothetical protein